MVSSITMGLEQRQLSASETTAPEIRRSEIAREFGIWLTKLSRINLHYNDIAIPTLATRTLDALSQGDIFFVVPQVPSINTQSPIVYTEGKRMLEHDSPAVRQSLSTLVPSDFIQTLENPKFFYTYLQLSVSPEFSLASLGQERRHTLTGITTLNQLSQRDKYCLDQLVKLHNSKSIPVGKRIRVFTKEELDTIKKTNTIVLGRMTPNLLLASIDNPHLGRFPIS